MKNFSLYKEYDYYLLLTPKETGLNVNIWVDNFHGYLTHENHEFIVYIQNSYNSDSKDIIPLLVTNNDYIKVLRKTIHITHIDLRKVILWIQKHIVELHNLADEKIGLRDFFNILKSEKYIVESNMFSPINEMAIIRCSDTGLDYKIWLDSDTLYKNGRHWHRVKVEDTNHSPQTTSWNSVLLDTVDFDKDSTNKDYIHYKAKSRKNILLWVNANIDLIKKVADKEMTPGEFIDNMLTLDDIKNKKTLDNKDDNVIYKIFKVINSKYSFTGFKFI